MGAVALCLVCVAETGRAQAPVPDTLTAAELQAAMPRLKKKQAEAYAPILDKAMQEFGINTPQRQAAFLAQVAHESGELRYLQELASGDAYNPQTNPKLAANLGNTKDGDGPLYKGRGPLQLTGRDNYRRAGEALNVDLVAHPESVADPEVGFRTSAWFWKQNGLNELADGIKTDADFHRISKAINRGNPDAKKPALHEQQRLDYFHRIQESIQPPPQPNTGPYTQQSSEARIGFDDSVPRGERMRRLLQISPLDSGFGGILLGNEPLQAPSVRNAQIISGPDGPKLIVISSDGTGELSGFSPTELWCAYHYVRPSEELQALGARLDDVGLVGIARNKMSSHALWEFAIHPAVANTILGREGMRLDMTIAALRDPRLPALPTGWTTYRWCDEPAVIQIVDGHFQVQAVTEPRDTLMRVQLWNGKKPVPADTLPYLQALRAQCEALRRIDDFARLVAVLRWLDKEQRWPDLPAEIQPERINLRNACTCEEVCVEACLYRTGVLTTTDEIDPYIPGARRAAQYVLLEAGRDYIIDMESPDFDAFTRLGDENGAFLQEDDDSAGQLDARMIFTPRKTAYYKLVATTYNAGKTGRYFFKVWEGRVAPGNTLLHRIGSLTNRDPLDQLRRGSHQKVHPLRLRPGESYRIDLSGSFDPFLRVVDARGKEIAQDDDSGEGLASQLWLTVPRTETYLIIVTSYQPEFGSYTLNVVREH